MDDQIKRKEIFDNYKDSIRRAKYAPLNKNALNLGNPNIKKDKTIQESDDEKNPKNSDFYWDYHLKKMHDELKKLKIYLACSIILSIVTIIIILSYI